MDTRADTASLGSAFTLTSGIFTEQQPHVTICVESILPDLKRKKQRKQNLHSPVQGLFTIIEPFCFLNQLSMDNISRQRWNGDQSRVRVTISLKSVSAFYFLLTQKVHLPTDSAMQLVALSSMHENFFFILHIVVFVYVLDGSGWGGQKVM